MTYLNLGWWSYPITIIWIVAITNAVNLIDGLDGLAVGVSAISVSYTHLHGAAGDLAAREIGEYGMIPEDIIERLPRLLR